MFAALRNKIPTTVAAAVGGGALGALAFGGVGAVNASDDCLRPPKYEWEHTGYFSGYNSATLRRGYEVYRQVCSTCHSMDLVAFRNLINVTHTEAQAKALAESMEFIDGPNAQGEMVERAGKLYDYFPAPYPNEEYARYINAGAYPPDLSLVVKARHDREDYIFALLTGYCDPPAGVSIREGLHYNPYFGGGAIGMAKALMDEGVEYEDGTLPTISQQAADVATFLAWASEPEVNTRKKDGAYAFFGMLCLAALTGYHKRFIWNTLKTRRVTYTDSIGKIN